MNRTLFKRKIYSAFLVSGIVFSVIVCKGEKLLLEKDSLYNNIRVVEEGRFISLYCGKGHQSIIDTQHPDRLVFNYTKSMMSALSFRDEIPEDVLLIGEGGGSIPKAFQKHFPNTRMDVVELDPEVDKIAQKYFQFKPTKNTSVNIMDGRMFVKKTKKKYDLIMLDAFRGGYIPVHLLTREFLSEVKGILKPGGIVVSNTFDSSKIRDKETNTYFAVFKNVYELVTAGNRILIADNSSPVKKDILLNRAQKLDAKYDFIGMRLYNIINSQFKNLNKKSSVDILTDDHSDVELLAN